MFAGDADDRVSLRQRHSLNEPILQFCILVLLSATHIHSNTHSLPASPIFLPTLDKRVWDVINILRH